MKLQSCMAVAVFAFSFSAVSSWASDVDQSSDSSFSSSDQNAVSPFSLDQSLDDTSGTTGGGHGGGGGTGGHGGGGGTGGHGGGGGTGGHGGGGGTGGHGGGGGTGGHGGGGGTGGHGGGGGTGGHGGGGHPGHGANPYPVHGGHYPWPHWPHQWDRPVYVWDWDNLHTVTCTATDDAGDLFPVTEDGYLGMEYQNHLAEIEDAAIDRCYDETGGDESCRLLDCEAGY